MGTDAFFLRRNNLYPKFVLNCCAAVSTDTMHRIKFKEGIEPERIILSYYNSISFAFTEICGRSYGGGVLEILPGEVGKVLVPVLDCVPLEKIREVLHQVDQIVRNGENIEKALDIVDNGILKEYLGIDEKMCSMSRGIWKKMQHRRLKGDRMADFKYIMQGFQKDINFFDEIKEVLETEDYTSIWILTAFVNERAICNLMPSIKKSKADISFIIGIRNNVSTYQALKCLINMKVSVFVFDTARIESIFHAKVIVGSGTNSAKVICGSANITTGGLANNIEAGIISKLNLRCESDEKFLTEVREYIDNIIHNYPQNVKKISEDRELDELYEQGLVVDENQRKLRNNFFVQARKNKKSL